MLQVTFVVSLNPLLPKNDLWILLCLTPEDFTLSSTRQFYLSNGDSLKGLRVKNYLPWPFTPKEWLCLMPDDSTHQREAP